MPDVRMPSLMLLTVLTVNKGSAQQPGDLGVLRGVAGGVAEEARIRGFLSPSLGGFGFICVDIAPSIVAGWQIGSRSPMSASGRFLPVESLSPNRLLLGGKAATQDPHMSCIKQEQPGSSPSRSTSN